MTNIFRLGVLMLVTLPWSMTATCADEPAFTVAIVPQFAPLQIYRDWTPVLAHLERSTGYHFQLRVYEQIPRFEAELAQGIPDLAYMNPYHLVMVKQAQDYRPLVRDDATRLSGVLVVQRDGPIKTLTDLNGKTVAFPSPNAFGASLYMRALLAEKEGLKINPVYGINHQSVYRQVMVGDAPAGGGVEATLHKEPEAVQAQLRVIYTTPGVAPHPFAAHPRVPVAAAKKIADALLAMGGDAEGSKLLAAVLMPQPVAADYLRDYEPLLRLNLEKYAGSVGK